MKNKCRTKKTFSILSLFLLISFFVFTTCSNVSSASENNSLNDAYGSSDISSYNFKGIISLGNAVPSALFEKSENDGQRNAFPTLSTPVYRVTATANINGVPTTVEVSNENLHTESSKAWFELNLEQNVSWTVQACFVYGGKDILIASHPVKLTADNPVMSLEFILKPNSLLTDDGTIDLSITVPEQVKYVKTESDNTNWPDELKSIAVSGNTAVLYCDTVSAGTYNVVLKFTDNNSVVLYSIDQSFCVLPGLPTNKWVSENDDGPISSGTFALDEADIVLFANTNILVKAGTNTEEYGNAYFPFKTLQNAVNKVASVSSASSDKKSYTIMVDGEVTGCTELKATLNKDKIESLTICGLTSNSSDKLNAAQNGRVLKVATEVPITIKNLTITGGKVNTGNDDAKSGAGIYIASGTVKLADGAKITGNNAAAYGGGVYIASGAKLFMYGSSLIGDTIESTATSSTLTSSGTTGCANTAKGGGGIYSMGAVYIGYDGFNGDTPHKSDMTAGYGICRNYASGTDASAGGIICRTGTLMIASGSISYNQSVNHGGGIYGLGNVTIDESNAPANKFVMYGNTALIGGAIYIGTGCTLTMQAGQIGGSTSGQQNTATTSGGAIYQGSDFKISGSALVYPGAVTSEVKTNDVFLPKGSAKKCFVTVNSGYSTTSKMSITPEEQKRGIWIVCGDGVTVNEDLWNKFALTQNDASWDREAKTVDSKNYVVINSPIYVAASDNTRKVCTNAPPATGADGLKETPFAGISDVISSGIMDNEETSYTITVDGTVSGNQEISGTYKAKSLTIKGAAYTENGTTKYSGVLKGSNGSTLTVNAGSATFPVTITNLKITGGNATNGGGIYLKKGTVALADGVVVSGNTASSGGGVYVDTDGKLLMYGTALIGDATSSLPDITNAKYGNKAGFGAGIYNKGIVALGYDAYTTESSFNEAELSGGVCRNYVDKTSIDSATSGGAGIYTYSNTSGKGILSIKSGKIVYNQSNSHGGGIKAYKGGKETVYIKGGSISNNKADSGGGIYIDGNGSTYGIVNISGGTISNNEATTAGGAIYQSGKLNFSANAKIDSGSEKINDVYLAGSSNYVTIAENNLSNSTVATITPYQWKRGNQVLDASSDALITSNYSRFKLSDSAWRVGYYVSGTVSGDYAKRIGAPLYVAGSTALGSYGAGKTESTGGRGTASAPYSLISAAVNQCWSPNEEFTINIIGTLPGAQTIPAANTTSGTALAKSIKLIGLTVQSNNATISGAGTGLTISNASPITIQNLKITGTTSGPGIKVNGVAGAKLVLSAGTEIYGNTNAASSASGLAYGGGVWFEGTGDEGGIANLIMESTAKIYGNEVTNGPGGGVHLRYANLCMSGSSVIGEDTNNINPADSSSKSNSAKSGGGVNAVDSYVWLGYKSASINDVDNSFSGGIYHNYTTADGSGIKCNGGAVYLHKGNISKNGSYCNSYNGGDGGGVYLLSNANMIMDGGSVSYNKGRAGGGIYILSGVFSMSGGDITGNDYTYESRQSGAIYAPCDISISGSAYIPCAADGRNVIGLEGDYKVNVTKDLSVADSSNPIRIAYSCNATKVGTTVLGGSKLSGNYRKFAANGTGYIIESTGKMIKGYYATSSTVGDIISSISNGTRTKVVVEGSSMGNVASALKNKPGIKVDLDLSGVTGLTALSQQQFENCTSLCSIALPSTVTTYGSSVFSGCVNLENVTGLEHAAVKLGGGMFKNCTKLTNLYVYDVQSFFSNTFEGWTTSQMVWIGSESINFGIYTSASSYTNKVHEWKTSPICPANTSYIGADPKTDTYFWKRE
ncbi:leucine-rich repeat protein [Treponema sp.]|uniref:leucine-rich repeat protein n=1 Tax=Treponema sp. TaxID=166 RepID=UPI00388EA2E9